MGTENIEKSTYQNSSPETNDQVATIPLAIAENNVLEGAREILKIIRPTWSDNNIKFKVSGYSFLNESFLYDFLCVLIRDVTFKIKTKRRFFPSKFLKKKFFHSNSMTVQWLFLVG